ncbi:MAG TPA: hypothetical protein VKA08_18800 [Balneolales bacterium]|nr:hypothetical protein [Balneolales bacterium]
MSSTIISITIYLFAANMVAGGIYIFGQKKVGLLWIEYPFIYTPWLAFMFLLPSFSTIPGVADNDLALKYFLLMVQGFSCGIFGGSVLLPRFWIQADSTAEKLKITIISSLVVTMAYLFSRWLLLQGFYYILK